MTKKRLTISLSQTTLNKIDHLVDNKQVRSRSHAIEMVLQKSLAFNVKKAVILAGSKEKQTDKLHPLTTIKDEPLINHTLRLLQKHQVEEVIILTNDTSGRLEAQIDQSQFNLEIKYIYEDQPLGTAGAIKNAQSMIGHETFYCLHADILTNIDLSQLAEFHHEQKAVATIALKPRIPQDSYDNVFLQGNRVVEFEPKKQGQVVSLVNTGVYVFSPDIFEKIPQPPSTLENDVFPQLKQSGRLLGFTFQGIWFDVTTDNNYLQALEGLEDLSN